MPPGTKRKKYHDKDKYYKRELSQLHFMFLNSLIKYYDVFS